MRSVRLSAAGMLLALGSLFLAPTGQAVAQDSSGVIDGQVVNGTSGAGPSDIEVVLHVVRGETHALDIPSRTTSDGGFAFEGLEADAAYTYQVTASYGQVTYSASPVQLEPGQARRTTEVTVYEPTELDPGLRVRRASLVLNRADPTSQTLQAIELVTLENPSSQTFRPSATGASGPMGLLRFPLPPRAGDLRPGPGLDGAEILQVDRGFATTLPVPPGVTEVVFAYRFPYVPGQPLAWERRTPYPTSELRVLLPDDGVLLQTTALEEAAPLQLDGRGYRLYRGQDLEAGSTIGFTVRGLPGRWPFGLPLDSVPVPAWGALGTTLALALTLGVAMLARRRASMATPAELDETQELAQTLVNLDEVYGAGGLSANDHQARQAEVRARLADRLRTQGVLRPAIAAPPGPEAEDARAQPGAPPEGTRLGKNPEVASA